MFQLFSEYAKTKNVNLLKFYFEIEFKEWITNHLLTMDTVTGAFLENPEKYLSMLSNQATSKCSGSPEHEHHLVQDSQ